MGEKIAVGPIDKGIRTDRTAFNIDNDSFPTLINSYQWRGRVKRKRGTSFLGRLTRIFNSGATTITLDGSGNGNLITGFSLQSHANIVPGSLTITAPGPVTYTDPSMNGTLSPSGTINYASGEINIAALAGISITAMFTYYPNLPVMGLRDLVLQADQFPGNLGFDTTYSYNILNTAPYNIYDVSFYKNPPSSGALPSYVPKTTPTALTWNGNDYQQFWTVNYQGALWATNGIAIPFDPTKISMQFKPIVTDTVLTTTTVTLNIVAHGLVVGDFLFINEVSTTTGINLQTGYVITVVDANNVTVKFPNATIASSGSGGIAQYLTNRSDATKDNLRWYDGDPTVPVSDGNLGWVNFSPPLSNMVYSIDDNPELQYYLVGAKLIFPFKDRLLFIGPVIQTSTGSPIYLQDAVIYSQNGTTYYTASFTGDVLLPTTVFHPLLVPKNQTSTPNSYFSDVTGFGGFIVAGFAQPINSVSTNEDVLILGFSNRQSRLVFTGNDIVPFNFFVVNSELGTGASFSTITLDRGVLSVGNHGIIMANQIAAERIDLDIPDQVFEFNITDNGFQRICSQRDYINEWVYFTYVGNLNDYTFPTQTLQYNYRDASWAIFYESYTTYGTFRKATGETWATIGNRFPSWEVWNEPWNSGSSTLLQPKVIGGNQQGFILFRDEGTGEGNSLEINNISFPSTITGATQANPAVLTANNTFVVGQQVRISGVVGMTQLNGNTYTITAVTPTSITISVNSSAFGAYVSGGIATPSNTSYSPNHCLNNSDYIVISGALGTIASQVNGKIFQVIMADQNSFSLDPSITSGTYLGGGLIQRMYIPLIQTKQFPVSWSMGRKTRIGFQQYLFTTTSDNQIELQIYLSQNAESAYNYGPVVPQSSSNNSLIYTDILYTCPESTNLGLTPANINLQMVTGVQQQQIWHRMNTSLIGDTVQIGFTLNDQQMKDPTFGNQFAEIELHGFILDVSPSQVLS